MSTNTPRLSRPAAGRSTRRRRLTQTLARRYPPPVDGRGWSEESGGTGDGVDAVDVWMVSRETGSGGWPGTLVLEADAVTFRPADGGGRRTFALSDIRKAHRVLGSPVLELRLAPAAVHRLVGFYFVRPPSLEGSGPRGRPVSRRTARKNAVLSLHVGNEAKKEEIRRWVEAIRRAIDARRAAD